MKRLRFNMLALFIFASGGFTVWGQSYQSEVPGDYFSLEGALELFKKSSSPEDFERLLNTPHSKVNNLDLNGDGQIDYIRVIDRNSGNVHAFILQAVISDVESQDVAVIELEKRANGEATLQITGDEDVYGIETIIEPTEEVRLYAGTRSSRSVANVWNWPSVQFVYSPYYSVWESPWHWHVRPIWWHSWRPVVYVEYVSYWQPYKSYYTRCHSHRIQYAQEIYLPHRRTSVVVQQRHHTQLTHYRSVNRLEPTSGRNEYGDRRNERGYERGHEGSKEREGRHAIPVRAREEQSSFTRNQHERKPATDKRPTVRRDEPSPAHRPGVRNESTLFERGATDQRKEGSMKRTENGNNNRTIQPRERPAMERSNSGRTSESPFQKREPVREGKRKVD